jgi:hypothetical protein
MRFRILLWSLALSWNAGTTTLALADDPDPKPGFRGRLYADLGGYLAIPHGPMTKDFDGTLTGFSFGFGVGLRGIPATLGLAAHETLVSTRKWRTGESGAFFHNGRTGFGDLFLGRRLDVRGVDLVLRAEPEDWRVRPFVEVRGGFLQMHCTRTLEATVSDGAGPLEESEKTGNIAWSWAYGGGLRVQFYRHDFGSVGDVVWLVSLGVRVVRSGEVRYLEPRTSQGTTTFAISQPAFQSIEPFLLIGFESRSPR